MKIGFLLFTLLTFLSVNLNAQDIITKRNGDDIEAKVLEISDLEIKYKKFNFLDGPTYTEKKSEILIIRYENGSKDIFLEKDKVKVNASTENANLPNRSIAIRGGLSLANIYNPTPLDHVGGYISKNINYAFSLNAFSLNKRFSLSLSVAPFNYIKEGNYRSRTIVYPITRQAKGVAILSEFYVHYGRGPKFSLYSGFGAGIRNIKMTNTPDVFLQNGSRVDASFHLTLLGAESYVTPNIGLYSELGYGRKGILSGGLQFQF
jgi:hypothetical protein